MADKLRDIDAPDDVEDAHNAYVFGLEYYAESMTEFLTTEAYERTVLEQPRFTDEHSTGERDYPAEVQRPACERHGLVLPLSN